MTSPSDSEFFQSYIPVYDAIPENWDDAKPFLVQQLRMIANAVNIREIGWFLDQEVLSGKAFIPASNTGGSSQQYRQVIRKVIDCGTLPDTSTKSIPHEIDTDYEFTLVSMFGAATNPTGAKIPLPYINPTSLSLGVGININGSNVNIITGSNRTDYTRSFIIIEYLQEL